MWPFFRKIEGYNLLFFGPGMVISRSFGSVQRASRKLFICSFFVAPRHEPLQVVSCP
jgi:hypothetical protein